MAFLLSGPGIAVRTCGLNGSSGKKGCSECVRSASCAVAMLAAGLVVVLMGLTLERRVSEQKRNEGGRKVIMAEVILVLKKSISLELKKQIGSMAMLKHSGRLCLSERGVSCRGFE